MTSFDKCGLQEIKVLGSGAYSKVYAVKDEKGELKALKLDDDSTATMEVLGITEMSELDVLTRLRHPNLMYTDRIITKLDCDIGGLGILLPLGASTLADQIKLSTYTIEQKIKHMFDVIDGMAYLHSQDILHLDLKPQNIILDKVVGGKAMVADFGLAVYIDNYQHFRISNRESITITYRPPELLAKSPWVFRPSADIWSIGIIALHLFSGQSNIYPKNVPWDNIKAVAAVYKDMFDTNRDITLINLLSTVPDKYRPSILDLVDQCLRIDQDKRPSAAQLRQLPLFGCFTSSEGGLTIIPNLPPKTDPVVRETIKYISVIAQEAYAESPVEVLFLAYDIAYRSIGPFLAEKAGSLTLALVSLWMAVKLIDNSLFPKATILDAICRNRFGQACIQSTDYQRYELVVIHELRGCLYRHYLYHAATDMAQLTQTYQYIVLDPSVYYIVDIPKWFEINKPVSTSIPKGFVKIRQFFKV